MVTYMYSRVNCHLAAEGNTIDLRSRLDVQKAVVAHKNRRTSKNPFMIININKRRALEVQYSLSRTAFFFKLTPLE